MRKNIFGFFLSGLLVLQFIAGLALPGGGYGTAGKAVANKLPDAASVCRGGACSAGNFLKGSNEFKAGLNPTSGTPLTGISVNAGDNLDSLLQSGPLSRYGQFGRSTVGDIKSLGGSVVPDGNKLNPSHANVNGLNARQLESTFSPTQKNPYKTK